MAVAVSEEEEAAVATEEAVDEVVASAVVVAAASAAPLPGQPSHRVRESCCELRRKQPNNEQIH